MYWVGIVLGICLCVFIIYKWRKNKKNHDAIKRMENILDQNEFTYIGEEDAEKK